MPLGVKAAIHISARLPSQGDQNPHNSALLRGSDPTHVEAYRLAANVGDANPWSALDVRGDTLLPRVDLEPRLLLWTDMDTLELGIGPMGLTRSVQEHSLGKELVPASLKGLDVDAADLDRPEASSTCLVFEIARPIRRADKNTLPVLLDVAPAVCWAVPLGSDVK